MLAYNMSKFWWGKCEFFKGVNSNTEYITEKREGNSGILQKIQIRNMKQIKKKVRIKVGKNSYS